MKSLGKKAIIGAFMGVAAAAQQLMNDLSANISDMYGIENAPKGSLFAPRRYAKYGYPEFYPRKHTKQTYAMQQRAAKKRRNKKKHGG